MIAILGYLSLPIGVTGVGGMVVLQQAAMLL